MKLLRNITGFPMEDKLILVYMTLRPLRGWSLNELYLPQKETKKSLQLHLYYPKSYADLE